MANVQPGGLLDRKYRAALDSQPPQTTRLLDLYVPTFFGPQGLAPTYDYPNPRIPRRGANLGTWVQNLLQTTLTPVVVGLPPGQNAQPERVPPRVVRQSDQAQNLAGTLFAPLIPPGQPAVTDVARGRPRPQTDPPLNLRPTLLAELQPSGEAAVTDIARGRPRPQTDPPLNLRGTLLAPQMPPGQQIVSDPARTPFPAALRTWTSDRTAFLTPVAAPFRQPDWPNPTRRKPPVPWAPPVNPNLLAPAPPPTPPLTPDQLRVALVVLPATVPLGTLDYAAAAAYATTYDYDGGLPAAAPVVGLADTAPPVVIDGLRAGTSGTLDYAATVGYAATHDYAGGLPALAVPVTLPDTAPPVTIASARLGVDFGVGYAAAIDYAIPLDYAGQSVAVFPAVSLED